MGPLKRDKVERIASYAIIASFIMIMGFLCFAMYVDLKLNESALFGGLVTLVTREMAALVIGRGEGGTYEGADVVNGNGAS